MDGVDPKVTAGVDGFSVVLFSILYDKPLFFDKLIPNEKEVLLLVAKEEAFFYSFPDVE